MGLLRSVVGFALDLMTDPTVEDEHTTEADGWTLYHETRNKLEDERADHAKTRESLRKTTASRNHENQQKLIYFSDVSRLMEGLAEEKKANAEARKTMDWIEQEKARMLASGVKRPTLAVVDVDFVLARNADYDEAKALLAKNDPKESLTSMVKGVLDERGEERKKADEYSATLRGQIDHLKRENIRLFDSWILKYYRAATLTEFVHEVIAAGAEASCQRRPVPGCSCRDCTVARGG